MNIIETERLAIKQISARDIGRLHQIYNEPDNMRFISDGKSDWTQQELMDKYIKTNKNYDLGVGIFALIIRETTEVIGEAGLFNSFGDLTKLELGYIIDKKYWLRGYGKETCLGLIDYAFNTLNVETLIARMYSKNMNSIALSESCGMIKVDSGITNKGEGHITFQINRRR